MTSPLARKEKYSTTLPISKEKALTVKVYCMIHKKTIYDFMDELLERELGEFGRQLSDCKKLRRQE